MAKTVNCTEDIVFVSHGDDDMGKLAALAANGKFHKSVLPDDAMNQNAFSNVLVNGTTIVADSQTGTLELAAGTNIELSADEANEKITIAVIGKVASAVQADSAGKLGTARTISITGDASGSGSFDGSADVSISVDVLSAEAATKLETSRTINGVSFDGSADIVITQVDGKDIATIDEIPSKTNVLYTEITGDLTVSSSEYVDINDFKLTLPSKKNGQTSALIMLNFASPYATGSNYPGINFGISYNSEMAATGGFTYENETPSSFARHPFTLVVRKDLLEEQDSIVQIQWANVRDSVGYQGGFASLSAILS